MRPSFTPAHSLDELIMRQRPRFDSLEARCALCLGQDAPIIPHQGRALLLYCPLCEHPWLRCGRSRSFTRLTNEQFLRLASGLQADINSTTGLYALPEAWCPICSSTEIGGLFSVEEYPPPARPCLYGPQRQQPLGFRFRWEDMLCGGQWICIVSRCRSLSTALQHEPDICLSRQLMQTILSWLVSLSPQSLLPFPFRKDELQILTSRLPPGTVMIPTGQQIPLQWNGFGYAQHCSVLSGPVVIALAWTVPCSLQGEGQERFNDWRAVARKVVTHDALF